MHELKLVPTFDFKQELLSHGSSVEVLAPEELRDDILELQVHFIYRIFQFILFD